MKHPRSLFIDDAYYIVEQLVDLLFLEAGGDEDYYNPDKQWDTNEICNTLAETLQQFDLVPQRYIRAKDVEAADIESDAIARVSIETASGQSVTINMSEHVLSRIFGKAICNECGKVDSIVAVGSKCGANDTCNGTMMPEFVW